MTSKPAQSKTDTTPAVPPTDGPDEQAEQAPPVVDPPAEAPAPATDKPYATKDDLKIPVLAEDDVVTLTGKRVRVRGLSRYEAEKLPDGDHPTYDTAVLKVALVQPADMTDADIEAWRRAAPTREFFDVLGKITELSGMGPDAGKAAYKSIRGESGS